MCSPNGKWSQEVNLRFSSLISNNDATQNFCVSFPIHPRALLGLENSQLNISDGAVVSRGVMLKT